MRLLPVLVSLLLGACGGAGGGSPPADASQPTPPSCCASTQEVRDRVAAYYPSVLAAYDERVRYTEGYYNGRGQFSSGAHYAGFAQDAIDTAETFANDSNPDSGINSIREIVNDVAPPYDSAALDELADDYRAALLSYVIDKYDYLHQRAGASQSAYDQYRKEFEDGINAVFDDLKANI